MPIPPCFCGLPVQVHHLSVVCGLYGVGCSEQMLLHRPCFRGIEGSAPDQAHVRDDAWFEARARCEHMLVLSKCCSSPPRHLPLYGERLPRGLDAMVATAGLLATLGLPLEVQGSWTERSERSVLPTALSLQDIPPHDKDLLGRWKPEGSDVYARSFGGRVARLQALFAEVARGADRYDERWSGRGYLASRPSSR